MSTKSSSFNDLSLQEQELLKSIFDGDGWMKVREVADGIRFSHSSVKYKLKDMTKAGLVIRKEVGKRGAYGYRLSFTVRQMSMERLRKWEKES